LKAEGITILTFPLATIMANSATTPAFQMIEPSLNG
jgi:hypothetical protein